MRHSVFGPACAFVLLLHPGAAVARVTADEVWAAINARAGSDVAAGAVTRLSDGIEISDLTVTAKEAGSFGAFTATLGQLVLRNTGDGRVTAVPSGIVLLKGTARGAAGETLETEGQVRVPNAEVMVSGSPDAMLFDVTMPDLSAEFSTTPPAATVPVLTVSVTAKQLVITQRPVADGSVGVNQDLRLAAATVSVDDTRDDAPLNANLEVSDLSAKGRFGFPEMVADAPFPGGSAAGRLSIGEVKFRFSAPHATAGQQGLSLDYAMTGITTEGSVDAKAVAKVGDIPSVVASGQFALGDYTYALQSDDREIGSTQGSGKGFSGSTAFTVPSLPGEAGLGEALAAGLSVTARLDNLSGNAKMAIADRTVAADMTTAYGPGSMEFSLSRSGLILNLVQADTSASLAMPAFGGPFDGKLAEMAMRLAGPVSPTGAAQPYALAFRMVGLTLGEAVWALFDPDKQIPRTPATLIAEVSGTARVTGDPFDETATADDLPLSPESFDLTRLTLSFGGAEIAGTGALSFSEVDGTPVPEGRITLTWKGVYGLLAKVGSVAMIPKEAMLGLRGALGMVGKAVGPDDLLSEFVFTPDGGVTANGTKLPFP